MQVALQGVSALSRLLFCPGMVASGGTLSHTQLLLPLGTGGLREVKVSELRVTPCPMLHQDRTCFAHPQL